MGYAYEVDLVEFGEGNWDSDEEDSLAVTNNDLPKSGYIWRIELPVECFILKPYVVQTILNYVVIVI